MIYYLPYSLPFKQKTPFEPAYYLRDGSTCGGPVFPISSLSIWSLLYILPVPRLKYIFSFMNSNMPYFVNILPELFLALYIGYKSAKIIGWKT